jgi:hypothetical protein
MASFALGIAGGTSGSSPDRLDALVWAMTDLRHDPEVDRDQGVRDCHRLSVGLAHPRAVASRRTCAKGRDMHSCEEMRGFHLGWRRSPPSPCQTAGPDPTGSWGR